MRRTVRTREHTRLVEFQEVQEVEVVRPGQNFFLSTVDVRYSIKEGNTCVCTSVGATSEVLRDFAPMEPVRLIIKG